MGGMWCISGATVLFPMRWRNMTAPKRKIIRQRKVGIPDFKSMEEEAKFWDTHSLADYWDEFKTVKVRFAKNLSEGVTVRFDPVTSNKLRVEAHQKGIGPTTLIRMWILERLNKEGRAGYRLAGA